MDIKLSQLIAAEAAQDYAANPEDAVLRQEARDAGMSYYHARIAAEIAAFGGPEAYQAAIQKKEIDRLRYAVKEAEDRLAAYRERRYSQSSCAPLRTHEEIVREAEAAVDAAKKRLSTS